MKTGRNLQDLSAEILRQAATKRDFKLDTRQLNFVSNVGLTVGGIGEFGVTPLCHDQIGERVGIPKRYYERMLSEAPGLLETNIRHWFQNAPERRLLRTLDGQARAFLSDRYRPLDHIDLAETVIPRLLNAGCRIESAQLTETRFYIKAVTPRLEAEVKVGDVVQAGITISNSEVGLGSVKVEPLLFFLVCSNGAIAPEHGLRKYHVGRSHSNDSDELDGAVELYRDETREADDKVFWLKLGDVVDGSLTEAKFKRIVGKFRDATERKIEGDPIKAVEVVANKLRLNEDEQHSVLRHLLIRGDLSQYGLSSAVTRMSQDVECYDRATELERLGGAVVDLPAREWREISLN